MFLSRIVRFGAAATLLSALTALTQTVTFSTIAYPNNNLWGESGGPNGHIRADLNGDGREDFISRNDSSFASGCTGSFAVTLSKGAASYAAPKCYTLPSGGALYFAIGNFSSVAGVPELVVANDTGLLFLYEIDVTGNLTLFNTFSIGAVPGGMLAADVNRDQVTDLIYDSPGSNGQNTLNVLFGSAAGAFLGGPSTTTFTMAGKPAGALFLGDFDNDSHTDVMVEGASRVGDQILYGDGGGHFKPGPFVGGTTTRYIPFDFDNSGTMDLIGTPFGANPSGTNTYYKYLDIEQGHFNRTLTSKRVTLRNCAAGGAPPAMADFNGDSINDIIVVEAADCAGHGPYTLNVLFGNGNETFQPEQVIYSTSDWMPEWHVMRASHSSKPDLTVFTATLNQANILDPQQLVLVNTTEGEFPSCAPPNFGEGLIVCSPTNTVGATSPVAFNFGASGTMPGRDIELWIDGQKVAENLKNTYTDFSFLNARVSLSPGQHLVTAFSLGWDGSLEGANTFPLTVGDGICHLPYLTPYGVNVCSPILGGRVKSPVLAYAAGYVASGIPLRMEVWVDGVKEYSTFGSETLKTLIPLAPGRHSFTYIAVDVSGDNQFQSLFVEVQ